MDLNAESDKRNESKKVDDDFKLKQLKAAKKPSIINVIFLNRTLRILFALVVFCLLLPIVDYFYFYSSEITEYQIDDSGICSHYPIYQIPCGGENSSEVDCIQNACCFSAKTGCYHFLPSKYQYRIETGKPWSSSEFLVPTAAFSPLKTKSFARLKLDIQHTSADTLTIIAWNPDETSLEDEGLGEHFVDSAYTFAVFSPELFVEVKRRIDNKTILSTARGPLIASDDYFEWSFYLNGSQLMGFDELNLKEGQRILINNEYSSVVPFVVAYDRKSQHYHAVHFESIDGPAEIQILKSNVIAIRQFHSSSFKVKLFTGPSFVDVRRQIMKHLPHYLHADFWTHGVHFCQTSVTYNETETMSELNHLLSDVKIKSIPFDSHCIHDELAALIFSQDETNLDGYELFIARMRANNKKMVFHVALSMIEERQNGTHQQTLDDELFLLDDDGANFAGIYGKSRKVFYLDYITKSQEIADFLAPRWLELANFRNSVEGIFLHKSFPLDDTANRSMHYLHEFRFRPNIESYVKNLVPLNLKLNNGETLIHQLNNYGRKQIKVFQSFNDENKFCISDSYREDSSCALLIREPRPSWMTFSAIVQKTLFYSLIGISFYGAEVCGSNDGSVAEDLCIRWYQFAVFSPLFYVRSDKTPLKFTKYAERIMNSAIQTRYMLTNYMRTHLIERKPLLRPLRMEYTDIDEETEDATANQFMFGESLMIAPVLEPLVVELSLCFPEKYFELWSGLEMPQNTSHFSVVMLDIPIFIRAGHIVAYNLAYESLSAEEARLQPLVLVVAFACTERFACHSKGRLVVERNLLEFAFEASESHLNITIITQNPNETRHTVCGPERLRSFSGEFQLAKIYGLGEFKQKYRNDYLSLALNICDGADWNETFSFFI